MENKSYLDNVIDFMVSKNNLKYLVLLFIIGILLRSLVAISVPPNADEMLHAPHAINFINSGKLQIMDQDPIWFFLTDLSYKIFGISLFSARFLSIIFGALSIIALYLIVSLVYNKRLALIASIILTFSSFHILMSLAEMDVAMTFFVLSSLFFFIKYLKEKREIYAIFSYILLGIAILTKQIAIMFLPAMLIVLVYYKLKNKEKITLKHFGVFILIMIIISLPVLTFNYLLYKDKGLVDLQFSRFAGIAKETYAPIEATLKPFKLKDVFFSYESHEPGIIEGLGFFYNFDKIVLMLGILGFILALFLGKEFLLLFALSFLFPFIFLSGTSLLEYHFIFGIPILAIFAAIFLDFLGEKLSKFRLKKEVTISVMLLLIIIFSVLFLNKIGVFSGKSEITKLMSYSKENINENSLVLVDSRIYRGRIVFSFNDKHYLEASQLNELVNIQGNLPGNFIGLNTYFIECIIDDCGWGTVNNQPEFNSSMEGIVNYFKGNSSLLTTISNRRDEPQFNVYNTTLNLKESSLELADSTHEWFYYPLRYEKESFDDYSANGSFDKLLDKIAHLVLYLEIIIALLVPIVLIYFLLKDKDEA